VAVGRAVALLVVCVVRTVLAFAAADRHGLAIAQGEDLNVLSTPHDLVTLVSLVSLPVLVAAWVATGFWLFAARRFSEQWPFQHSRRKVWCWIGWVVPVVWLWFPYRVVRDVWWASTTVDHWHPSPPGGVGPWWALLLVGACFADLADLAERFAFSGDGAHLSWLGPLNGVSTTLLLGAFIAWTRIVTSVARLREAASAIAA
jgi:hypothetical protein